MPLPVLYTAAHAGFDLTRVPLGGAATIATLLSSEWKHSAPFPFEVLSPAILQDRAPREKDLVRFSELQYARFCFEFESAATTAILRHNPDRIRVLCNDVSEGPDFRRLGERGYNLCTIYHVNVADYFAQMYLRGIARTETLTAWHRRIDRTPLRGLIPRLLDLVFTKQRDSLLYSRAVIVPSHGMKDVLVRSYPEVDPAKIHVLPWGVPARTAFNRDELDQRIARLRQEYKVGPNARVVLTLSRISPEKGQDRLLEALREWETASNSPQFPVVVFICGEAAYMQGLRFERRLRRLAGRLRKIQVYFPGHVSGLDKAAYFELADLYIFPSRHESYGLTLLEAFQAGLPAIACAHYGGEEAVKPEFGTLLGSAPEAELIRQLARSLACELANPAVLKEKGRQAQVYAAAHSFERSAAALAAVIQE